MKPALKNILMGIVIVAVLLGAYYYFSGSKSEPKDTLSSSSGASTLSGVGGMGNIAEDTSFLTTLISLTNINIDSSLFTSKTFSSLVDNTVVIEKASNPGRTNPFAPIEETPVLPVETDVTNTTTLTTPTTTTASTTPTTATPPASTPVSNGSKTIDNSNMNSILNRLLNSNSTKQ
jgi:hypothetical protein